MTEAAAMTIEELLQRHFLVGRGNRGRADAARAMTMTEAEAQDLCGSLTPRQRDAVRPEILDAIDALFTEAAETFGRTGLRYSAVGKLKALDWWKGRRSPEREQSWCAVAALHGLLSNAKHIDCYSSSTEANRVRWAALGELTRERLGKRPLKLDAAQVLVCVESSRETLWDRKGFAYAVTGPTLKSAVELAPAQFRLGLGDEDLAMLRRLRDQLVKDGYGASSRTQADWLAAVLGQEEQDPLWPGEPWAKAINESMRSLPAATRGDALKLLKYAGSASEYSKPAKGWFRAAQKIVDEDLGIDAARPIVLWWLRAFADDERKELAEFEDQYGRRHSDPRAVHGPRLRTNSGYMAGVAYAARCVADAQVLSVLADIVERVARAKHAVREHAMCVATAALRSIEASDHEMTAPTLSRLTLRLRWPKIRKAAEKAFEQYLARKGLSRDDAEEASVPDFDMTGGVAKVSVGDAGEYAEIAVGRSDRPRVTWHRPGKEPTHVTPKALKQAHPHQVKAVAQAVDDVEKMLAAQRTRIDLLFRRESNWPYDTWRQRYLEHGLLGVLTRRLIWVIDDLPLLHVAGAWEDVRGRAAAPIRDSARVMLWHPASRSAEEVHACRQRLETLGVTQPIKQAHREVYLLTEAERRTRTYSNRFAAHIVRNHATLAISQVRKWKMGMYGGDSSPSLALPHFGLRAEWWVQPAGDDHDRMGFPLYLQTDQVRFYREGETEPLPLADVPPLAFTEVMRDVDLFVGLASVGNDPSWQDGGPDNRYRTYWQQYSFGDLTETAKTRRAVLERLIPRLKIASRCSLDDKFLVVRGDIRSYKIHLGSGNILMTPNDQYLCIVTDRGGPAARDVFLPFEGDTTLSVVLSKAFLLADDQRITDPTIVTQIRR